MVKTVKKRRTSGDDQQDEEVDDDVDKPVPAPKETAKERRIKKRKEARLESKGIKVIPPAVELADKVVQEVPVKHRKGKKRRAAETADDEVAVEEVEPRRKQKIKNVGGEVGTDDVDELIVERKGKKKNAAVETTDDVAVEEVELPRKHKNKDNAREVGTDVADESVVDRKGKRRKTVETTADEVVDREVEPQRKQKSKIAVGEAGGDDADESVADRKGKRRRTSPDEEDTTNIPAAHGKVVAKDQTNTSEAKAEAEKGKGKDDGKKGSGSWSNQEYRLFVHNLNRAALDEDALRAFFAECGELADVYAPIDWSTGNSKGFAFITYREAAGCDKGLQKDGAEFQERKLKVSKAAEKGKKVDTTAERSDGARSERPKGCTSIVCKRLSPKVTEDDLRDFFEECGRSPSRVGLLKDREGNSRLTARVDFAAEDDVDEAVTLTAVLRGKSFLMDYCKPKG